MTKFSMKSLLNFWMYNVVLSVQTLFRILTTPIYNRIHLFEIHDLNVVPTMFRNVITDALAVLWSLKLPILMKRSTAEVVAPLLVDFLQKLQGTNEEQQFRVLDICSGGGGPILKIMSTKLLQNTHFTLSDLFPNVPVYRNVATKSNNRVLGILESVDATNVPTSITKQHIARTSHASFHHMTPELGVRILSDAVRSNQGIMIVEITQRSLWVLFVYALFLFPAGLVASCILALRYICDCNIHALVYTPTVPFILWFDGIVSCLRTYSEVEFRRLVSKADPNDEFEWEVRTHWSLLHTVPIVVYTGIPTIEK